MAAVHLKLYFGWIAAQTHQLVRRGHWSASGRFFYIGGGPEGARGSARTAMRLGGGSTQLKLVVLLSAKAAAITALNAIAAGSNVYERVLFVLDLAPVAGAAMGRHVLAPSWGGEWKLDIFFLSLGGLGMLGAAPPPPRFAGAWSSANGAVCIHTFIHGNFMLRHCERVRRVSHFLPARPNLLSEGSVGPAFFLSPILIYYRNQ